jgi:hypothetical protein
VIIFFDLNQQNSGAWKEENSCRKQKKEYENMLCISIDLFVKQKQIVEASIKKYSLLRKALFLSFMAGEWLYMAAGEHARHEEETNVSQSPDGSAGGSMAGTEDDTFGNLSVAGRI